MSTERGIRLDAAVAADALPDVSIVPMTAAHLRRVLAIERTVYERGWTKGMYESELALPATRAFIVALVGRELTGYAGMMMAGETGHIATIAVAEKWRRHGIATRLLVQLSAEILRRGGSEATLEVRESGVAALGLYERFGYERVGRRKNYYPRTREDAIIMTAGHIDSDAYAARLRKRYPPQL